ncbi:helix-turn-helix domain-containing protein [Saccharopolyspora sp. K220]|uniref:helix-turn-helix domain-containing protein n=1 Tax=Saccharopolyspora soli TaxID=2926618 RepID=UPI001F5896D4|nr:helix-turn-helix domain-containing protein [Saccharopolyspora soli]MCI2420049.1 helix-turn-helix domain-containing protein [Saccharopolyspora soli]
MSTHDPLTDAAAADADTLSAAAELASAARELADAVRTLAEHAPHDSDALLTAEQLGDLLRLSPRTLKEQAAAGLIPHRRFGKHYRFSRDDAAEIVRLAGKTPMPQRRGFRAA